MQVQLRAAISNAWELRLLVRQDLGTDESPEIATTMAFNSLCVGTTGKELDRSVMETTDSKRKGNSRYLYVLVVYSPAVGCLR